MRFFTRIDVLFWFLFVAIVGLYSLGITTTQWSIAAVLFSVPAFFIYVVDMIRKNHHSSSSTWIVWVILDWISLVGMLTKNELNGLVLVYTIGATTTCAIVLYRDGWSKWKRVDKLCTGIAFIGIALWKVFDQFEELPLGISGVAMGIGCAQVAGIIGSIPMWILVYQKPYEENAHAWVIWGWSCIIGLMAVSEWSFVKYAAPVTFTIIEVNLNILMYIRRKKIPPPTT